MIFRDPFECYGAIADELATIVPAGWTKIEVEAVLLDRSVDFLIEHTRPDGSKESRVRPRRLGEYFYELARLVSTKEKGLYKTCHFRLDADGRYHVDFVY